MKAKVIRKTQRQAGERTFQEKVIRELRNLFPGCIILKNNAHLIQGVPDLLMLYGSRWAALECKISETADRRPNQEFYVDRLNQMSYAAFIYPENMELILDDLQRAFRPRREARVPGPL